MPDLPPDARALRILVVDDEENIRFALSMCLEADGHKVIASGTIEGAFEQTARYAFDLIFLDVRLGTDNGLDYIPQLLQENPWTRIVVITAYASISTAVDAMKLGASDYLAKPFEHTQLLLLTRKVAERRQLEQKLTALQAALGSLDPESDFPTASPVWREAIELARRVATSNAVVLIQGEPGTGRGRLARAVHSWSLRSGGPFASFSARSSSADEQEAELFGAGSQNGAKVGAVAQSHGGTMLIEDVGELPLRLQPRLLALLRDKEFEPLDSPLRRPIDVRVIATTGPGLGAAVEGGRFRMDLYAALNVVSIEIPPLRDRPEDIPILAERYLAYFTWEHHRRITGFTRDASFLLQAHTWPGNTRELRNAIERAVLVCSAEQIGLEHLPAELVNSTRLGGGATLDGYSIGDFVPLQVIEEMHIRKVLTAARTTRRASAILGINASTLFRKLKQMRAEIIDDQPSQ